MPAETTPPTIEPAEVKEQQQPSNPVEQPEENTASTPEEESQQQAEQPTEEQDQPTPETDRHLQKGNPKEGQAPSTNSAGPAQSANIADEAELVLGASPRGLVRGIVYSDDSGSVLVDDTIVKTGGIIDGVKVVRVHADGVDFEKNGRRWTQKVSETPAPLWQ